MRNKFLTKILGATLGIAMAIGVGAGVASFVNREAKKLDAASGSAITSFTAASADFDSEIEYASYRGGGTSNPAVNSNQIRLYQGNGTNAGGMLVVKVKSTSSVLINSITVGTGMATTLGYKVGSEYTASTAVSNFTSLGDVANGGTKTVSDLSATVVTFACLGTTSSSRWYVNRLSVTYSEAGDAPTVTSITASLKDGDYYAGNTLVESDFNITANMSEGDPTHPESGFTWTVNGEENGALVLGENTIVVTYQEQSATIENFEATRDPRWVTSFSNTKVNAITLPEVENVETDNKYYVTAKITAITSSTYGNGNAVDEDGTAFAIFGMYNFNGSARYDSMIADQKPVAGDIVVLYGAFVKYSGAPEIKNAWLVQHNGNVLKQLSSSIDLTTDNTSSKSASMVTWGNPETPGTVGLLLSKGTSGTDANNYLGGVSARTSTRFYSGQTLVVGFNPVEFKMVKIIFTATSDGYASTFAGSTFDNATAVANSKTVTVTVTKGTQTVTAHVTGTCGFEKVEFVYEEASAQQKVECGIRTSSAIRYNYVKNGENDFTITDAKIKFGGYVTKALWDELNAESPIQGYGVMISTADLDPDGYIGDEDFKTEYAIAIELADGDVDDAIDLVCSNDKILNFAKSGTPYLHEAANEANYTEDTYAWNLVQSVNSDHLTRTYVAIAYIRTNAGLVFLEEERISVQDIATRMVGSGDYDGSPLYESLDYLSNLQ